MIRRKPRAYSCNLCSYNDIRYVMSGARLSGRFFHIPSKAQHNASKLIGLCVIMDGQRKRFGI